jgi:hypothetical protein
MVGSGPDSCSGCLPCWRIEHCGCVSSCSPLLHVLHLLLLPAAACGPPRDLHDLSRNGQLRGYIPYTWDSNTWPLKYV